jgi:uncharacterized protein (AIM24 family)
MLEHLTINKFEYYASDDTVDEPIVFTRNKIVSLWGNKGTFKLESAHEILI